MPPVVSVKCLGLGESGLPEQAGAFGFGPAGVLHLEQACDGHAKPVMVGLREPFARVEPRARQRLVPLRRRDRHHQVAAHEPDRVLHAALLVARVRIAEPRLEPVLRAEPLEHHGLRDRAVRVAVANARGVVRAPPRAAPSRHERTPRPARGTHTPTSRLATP